MKGSVVISNRFSPTENSVDFTGTFMSKVNRQRPDSTSHSFTVASADPVTNVRESPAKLGL
jgi:hypothetical protein